MHDIDLDELFHGYLEVAEGIRKMIQLWEIGSIKLSDTKSSLAFNANYRVVFRVGTAISAKVPEVVIYTGPNDKMRGSNLVKEADEKYVQKLKHLGFDDSKPGWRKTLTDNTGTDFYINFVDHALKIAR